VRAPLPIYFTRRVDHMTVEVDVPSISRYTSTTKSPSAISHLCNGPAPFAYGNSI
jgi:hypothetical protein